MHQHRRFSRRLRQAIFQLTQKIPTWLVVTLTVLLLSFLTIWFHDDLKIASLQDVFTRSVLKVLLENAESIAIVAAVVLYFKEAPDRKEQKHYDAWQVINNAGAAKISTSYARFKALQDLNEDGMPLKDLDVSGADLQKIVLPEADLQASNLEASEIMNANLTRANLSNANLTRANLNGSNLNGSNLSSTNLSGANFCTAKLIGADLTGADLNGATFYGADLTGANFSGASWNRVRFSNANLRDANFLNCDLSGADFSGSKNLTRQQIVENARNWRNADFDPNVRQMLEEGRD